MKRFLYVDSEALPEYFIKVLDTKKLLESDASLSVSAAARQNGISRSTYYKYKDSVFENRSSTGTRCATFMLSLSHETGVLSNVLGLFSSMGASILTISQSLPVDDSASVMLTADVERITGSADELIKKAFGIPGVKQIRLLAMS